MAVSDPTSLDRAAAVLLAGGTVVLPTDTVYGLAALPSVPGATDQLVTLKARSVAQPFAVLVGGEVNRIFYRIAVGWPGLEPVAVGKTNNFASVYRDQIR